MAMIVSTRRGRLRLGPLKSTLNFFLNESHYTPLSEDPSFPHIRLIKILPDASDKTVRCELHQAVLWPVHNFERIQSEFEIRFHQQAVVQYDALSYVWGDTMDKVAISVDGKDLQVTQNLWLALRRLRKPSMVDEWESLYWIDAICINQEDLAERSRQVQLMAQIYSTAQQVVVWLGEEDKQSRMVFQLLRTEWDFSTSGPKPWDDFSQLEAFRTTFRDRSWWKRLWVVQEVCHAQAILLQCGSDSLEWKHISAFYKALQSKWGLQDEKYKRSAGSGPRLYGALEVVGDVEAWRLRSRQVSAEGMVSPEEAGSEIRNLAVEKFGQRQCTDPRDSIYGLLSISPLLAFVVPDYSLSTAAAFCSAAKAIISIRHDLDILSRVPRSKSPSAHKCKVEKGLPSWVPDWSQKMEYEDLLSLASKDKPYNASGNRTFTGKALSGHDTELHLDGILWDEITTISEIQWRGNSSGFSGDETASDELKRFMSRLVQSERGLRGWSAFTTKTGAMGLVLGNAYIGDSIFIIYGSKIPILLRNTGLSASMFRFGGVVYCEPIMYGEPVRTMRQEYEDSGEKVSWIGKSFSRWRTSNHAPKLVVRQLVPEEIRLI